MKRINVISSGLWCFYLSLLPVDGFVTFSSHFRLTQDTIPARNIFASIEEPEVLLNEEHVVSLRKPMGIILQTDDADPAAGVIVKHIDPHGPTAAACRSNPSGVDICIRDKVIRVNGRDVSNDSLEEIMALITDGPEKVELVLGRPSDAVVLRWANGVSVAARPGDSFGCIAQHEAGIRIPYSCASGICGTCEQSISTEDGEVSFGYSDLVHCHAAC